MFGWVAATGHVGWAPLLMAALVPGAATFKDFPPVQRPNTITIDDAITKIADANAGAS